VNIIECPACNEAFFRSSLKPAPSQEKALWHESNMQKSLCPNCGAALTSKYRISKLNKYFFYSCLLAFVIIKPMEVLKYPFGEILFFTFSGLYVAYFIARAVKKSKDPRPYVVDSSALTTRSRADPSSGSACRRAP
jgi:hypothetical protein